jgi:hypothetical protein
MFWRYSWSYPIGGGASCAYVAATPSRAAPFHFDLVVILSAIADKQSPAGERPRTIWDVNMSCDTSVVIYDIFTKMHFYAKHSLVPGNNNYSRHHRLGMIRVVVGALVDSHPYFRSVGCYSSSWVWVSQQMQQTFTKPIISISFSYLDCTLTRNKTNR